MNIAVKMNTAETDIHNEYCSENGMNTMDTDIKWMVSSFIIDIIKTADKQTYTLLTIQDRV